MQYNHGEGFRALAKPHADLLSLASAG